MRLTVNVLFGIGLILSAVDGLGQVIYPPGYVGVSVQSGGIVVPESIGLVGS